MSQRRFPPDALKRGLLLAVFMAQLIASTPVGWTQALPSLQRRIRKPDSKKYHAIRDAADWKDGCRTLHPYRFRSRRIERITGLGVAIWTGRGSSRHRNSVTGRPSAH